MYIGRHKRQGKPICGLVSRHIETAGHKATLSVGD